MPIRGARNPRLCEDLHLPGLLIFRQLIGYIVSACYRIFLLFVSIWSFGACSPTNSNSTSSTRQDSASERKDGTELSEEPQQPAVDPLYVTREKVSRFSLDDERFNVVRLAVGFQTFMTSQSPVVSYKLPRDSDYVEILRCRHDAVLNAGPDPISLVDLELSGLSEFEKGQLYRSNDYFKAAEDSNSCELITDGHLGESFIDSFSPSGTFRYLVRSCVTPTRLVDTEKLSSRNCSRRVAISSEVTHTNTRKEKEQDAFKMTSIYAAKIDATTTAMRALADEANDALTECEERNRQRIIDKKIRDAWITIGSAIIEVGIELVTVDPGDVSRLRYYFWGKRGGWGIQSTVDRMQLLGALQGYLLADTFIKLAGSAHDMPRSCTRYKRLIDEYGILQVSLTDFGFQYAYYFEVADLARKGQLVVDGEPVTIPTVDDIRLFDESTDLPPPPESTDDAEGGDNPEGEALESTDPEDA